MKTECASGMDAKYLVASQHSVASKAPMACTQNSVSKIPVRNNGCSHEPPPYNCRTKRFVWRSRLVKTKCTPTHRRGGLDENKRQSPDVSGKVPFAKFASASNLIETIELAAEPAQHVDVHSMHKETLTFTYSTLLLRAFCEHPSTNTLQRKSISEKKLAGRDCIR